SSIPQPPPSFMHLVMTLMKKRVVARTKVASSEPLMASTGGRLGIPHCFSF
ncbi:hypothetical protein PHISCL_10710, partial [Aspergillus sclerotialis]